MTSTIVRITLKNYGKNIIVFYRILKSGVSVSEDKDE